MKNFINKALVALMVFCVPQFQASASSHREAPLIAYDPQADNTDLYAFKSPCDAEKIILIANYMPFELPNGGPNYYNFGENVRYEIHVDNNTLTPGDDIIYRFTFTHVNEDSTTFFNIRLHKQNLKTTYICERSTNGGLTFTTIASNGTVPPNNIGPRSIMNNTVGLGATDYGSLMTAAITTASTGERIFCGPIDDPFFVDLGGAFDVGGFRPHAGRDGLAKYNVHSIVIEVPVSTLQKTGQSAAQATNILDPNYVIGVWASASRPQITALSTTGGAATTSGNFVQVSRLGMPLTNEVVIPIGMKDMFNASAPTGDQQFAQYLYNPELALYMDDSQYGSAVPGLDSLRIQANSLGMYDFRNGHQGLYPLRGSLQTLGTALSDIGGYGPTYLPNNASPRSVDLLPIFFTGIPNQAPYQLATGKNGNPLNAGKPFINNFMQPIPGQQPVLEDMLRLNMAVPATPRNDANFSSLGLVKAAVLGLTDPMYANTNIQFIPNMDGFPNGRRLEDDVTTIELQAVSGVVLAAIGLWYDDYIPNTSPSPVTPNLVRVLGFDAGITHNDTTFQSCFPFVQQPWAGFTGPEYVGPTSVQQLGLSTPMAVLMAYPNPFTNEVSFKYKVSNREHVRIDVTDITGRLVQVVSNGNKMPGEYTEKWNSAGLAAGTYFAKLSIENKTVQTVKLTKTN